MRNPLTCLDRGVRTSQKDCACAVTRFMKLLFLTSDYCMKTCHTFNMKEYGIKKKM